MSEKYPGEGRFSIAYAGAAAIKEEARQTSAKKLHEAVKIIFLIYSDIVIDSLLYKNLRGPVYTRKNGGRSLITSLFYHTIRHMSKENRRRL
ncbi:MAG: hypothetical protein ACD_47C00546G0002 [uncultured bacterium]|nr:MAG: hypothetical protein ACD_47C00546G0002 [uncultured bacterium]